MKQIPVTEPFLPPLEEYQALLQEAWKRNWLTNNGPLVQQLEQELKTYLDVPYLKYVSNGTIALQIAIRALDLKGEIITTPFSFVATTSSIAWEGCEPVFIDIDPNTLNIDPSKIEYAITPNTSAILATHVYGNPCDIDSIQAIADQYGLKVIYDAAHCFGTKYKGKSVYHYGDVSTASFHATKLYHTVEGGALFTSDPNLAKRIHHMRNFGHAGIFNYEGIGINGKNSELHAAMGLVNLKYIDAILAHRKKLAYWYDQELSSTSLQRPTLQPHSEHNCAYYAVLFETEKDLVKVFTSMEEQGIHARRYFYPLLSTLEYVTCRPTPIAADIASRVLCLPLFHSMSRDIIHRIINILAKPVHND